MLLAFYQRPQIHNSKCTNPLINAQQNPTRRTMSNEDVLLFEHLRGKQIHFLNLHSKITVICPVTLSIYTSFLCTLPGSNSPGYNTRLQKGSEVHEIPEQQTWLGFKTLLGMLSKKPKISHNSVLIIFTLTTRSCSVTEAQQLRRYLTIYIYFRS